MSVETHRWARDVNHTSQSFPRRVTTQSIEEALSFLFGYEAGSLQLPKIKNLPAMQETQVQSLSWEDPLEKEMATHSSIPVWEIPRTEEPGGLQSTGVAKSWTRLSN